MRYVGKSISIGEFICRAMKSNVLMNLVVGSGGSNVMSCRHEANCLIFFYFFFFVQLDD